METLNPPVVVPFKDRKTGLIVFGVLEILVGGICALFMPLMLLGTVMSARTGAPAMPMRAMLPAVGMYGVMAAIFITLGIGSIRARRWGRNLSLILAWSWLVMGVVMTAVYAFVLPRMFASMQTAGEPPMPEGVRWAVIVFAMAFIFVLFVVLPGVLVLFYQSRHVKATCEARDPVSGWTEACPLPVLGLSLWLAAGAAMMLTMPVFNSVVPVFGRLVSGLPGTLVFLVVAATWLYAAREVYRLNPAGWWVALGVLVLVAASSVMTFVRVDLMEMYRLMGYPEATVEQMQKYNVFGSTGMWPWVLMGFVPWVGYLLFVRRYFSQRRPATGR